MNGILQVEEVAIVHLHDAPRLLVEWSPRWNEFVTSIGPAFARSGPRLAGEAPLGIFPYRGMLASFLLESFLVFVVMVRPPEIDHLRPYAAPRVRPYEVIYYSGDELPRTEDLGGAQAGSAGRAGGQEAYHRTQTIRVARGGSLAAKVVDAPDLKLPPSTGAVANLLAFKSTPASPPAEGLHSTAVAPSLPANVIAPAPVNVARDQSRRGLKLDSVVAPAPSVSDSKARNAPVLDSTIVVPAPDLRSEHALIAPSLSTGIIAPAPTLSREHALTAPSLNTSVISPASAQVSRDRSRSAPALSGSVIPPAPLAVGREVSPTRVQMNSVAVVPPPVSAPERDTSRTAKLNLPAPSVVAPPPSDDSARDLRRLESGSAGAASPAVVPPPPTQTGNPSFVSSIIGKLFGTQDVVPPPPAVASATRNPGSSGGTLAANVVPPPPSPSGPTSAAASGMARRGSFGTGSLGTNVVPPPPSMSGATGSAGTTSRGTVVGAGIVPPPPSVDGPSARGSVQNRNGASGATSSLANNIVPPPPSLTSGSGRRNSGLGGPGDNGSVLAPPKDSGAGKDNSGVVLLAQPGSVVGVPGGGKGALAMSPSGGDKPGLGGSGGGTGIGRGEDPGSGLTGTGAGAGKTGTGHGSEPDARAGISPTPGPGGAGSAPTGIPAVPGVDVRGGSTIVTLPSFGSGNASPPSLPGRTSVKEQQGPAITIVATSRSGGAFDFYGRLPGDNYTVYVDTAIGTVVMQFAEANPAASANGTLTGPQGIRNNLPADLPQNRVVVKCRLDASGNLRNLQVLEPGPAAMTAKIIAALPSWKFRPAMRGAQPVEVNAILGFNINTNDRN